MKTQVDTYIRTGYAHYICEDFVLSGNDPVPHIILSDGCSSSCMTDTGARILALAARSTLMSALKEAPENIDIQDLGKRIIESAGRTALSIDLPTTALDATLMIGYALDGRAYIHIFGDGVVIWSNHAGAVGADEISYSNNAPYYLSYQLDSARDAAYRGSPVEKRFGGEIVRWDFPVSMTFSIDTHPLVMICSDGAASFKDTSGTEVPLSNIAAEFVRFKTTGGEFLKRRLKRSVKNFEAKGVRCYDDLSAGALLTICEPPQRKAEP